MTLDQVLSELQLSVDPTLLAPHWDEDAASLPDRPDLLEPAIFLPIRDYLRLEAEVDEQLLSVAEQVRETPALKLLWWHCHNLLFHHLDYQGGQVRHWPTLGHLLGDRHGVFYLLVAFGSVPLTRARHASLGVPEEVAAEGLPGNFHECVGNYRTLNPGRWGVDLRVLYWLRNDTEGHLFRLGRIEYMVKPFHGQLQAFRSRRSGETIALAADGVYYNHEGYLCGSPESSPGGWQTTLTFTDEAVKGYRLSPLGHCTRVQVELPLDEWVCALKPGDGVLEMHIPGGGGFDPGRCRESMERAAAFFPHYLPDRTFVGFACMSWILNPQIDRIYRPDSNMVLWQQELYLFPIPCSGRDGLFFLFARDDVDPATAPRDTSMRRAFLDWLESGRHLMAGGAFMLTDDLRHYGTQHYPPPVLRSTRRHGGVRASRGGGRQARARPVRRLPLPEDATMKPVTPKRFYITEWAAADPACVARMERLMGGFGVAPAEVRLLREAELEQAVRDNDWFDLDIRQGRSAFEGDPDVVFNKLRWIDGEERRAFEQRHEMLRNNPGGGYTHGFLRMLYGIHDGYHYEDGMQKRNSGATCWSLYDLHSAYGCFHKCRYCRRGRVTTLALNVEEFLDHTDRLMADNPWQRVFRYDVETDCLVLEPEYGMCRALVEHYAALPDKYLILFSKSDNVDFLLDLPHEGHTVMLWTLTTPTVSRRVEIDTATTEQRLEAARKCQAAGYTVRFKFKPIVPVANWREEATETLEKLFAAVVPDNLSMELLFFDSVAEFRSIFAEDLFAPELLTMLEAHEASGQMTDRMHPFPFEFRVSVYEHYAREIQRLSPDTRLSLCAETREMWERLGPTLGVNGDSFACNCGPVALPGIRPEQIATTEDGKAVVR